MSLSCRTVFGGLLAVTLATPGALACQNQDPDRAVSGGGQLPTGWEARTDRGRGADQIKFMAADNGYHVTLGPAAIFYRNGDTATGSYQVQATLTQLVAPSHPESYGLFIGGKDLTGDGQQYTYFLVRGDGKFLVKRRTGATTETVNDGWTANAAVKAADDAGKASNTLTIAVAGDKVSFKVNGTEVYSAPAAGLDVAGIAGLRINHNLDLTVDGFKITKG